MRTISVVIPVRNAMATLPGCCQALRSLDPQPTEVVLVDNGSTDGSLDVLKRFASEHTRAHVRILTEMRRGASAARNAGIQSARGDVVAFTDADCVPDPSWLRYLAGAFDDQTVGAVAGRIVARPTGTIVEQFNALYTLQSPESPARHCRWTPWAGGFPTANLAVRRELLQRIGGFDESVRLYGEDYDVCARLYETGAAIDYVPDARVTHVHRATLGGMMRQAFGFGRSHPYLLRRHASGLWLDVPGRSVAVSWWPIPSWIDLASADKKALALLVVGMFYPPALLGLAVYGGWLWWLVQGRARRAGVPVSGARAIGMAGLLLLKSSAMTLGRWWGSVKYGVLCL